MPNARPTYDGASYRPKEDDHRRKLAEAFDRANAGKINCVTDLTLAANAGSTTLTDARIGYFSAILLQPMTANAAAEMAGNRMAQVVNSESGALATGATIIPVDDTIPQSNEGDQYLALAITPTNAASTLIIDVVMSLSNSAASQFLTAALYQDAAANALAAATAFMASPTGIVVIAFSHKMIAGTTSSTAFKVRAGAVNVGITILNGANGGRYFGGVMASSITITEVLPAAPLSIAQATMLKGSAVIAHQNGPQTDRTFRAVILG